MEQSATATKFIKSTVEASPASLAAAVSVRAAFVTHDDSPSASDWVDAELIDGKIRILVGPDGGHPLAAATYLMWGEITAPPELIREPCPGYVRITP